MLMFDLEGRIIPPGLTVKTWGGDFDQRGIPADCSIPQTGDYSDVSHASSSFEGVTIARPDDTPGLARVQGPLVNFNGNVRAMRVQVSVIGAGSGITTSDSKRDFAIGFLSDDGQNGALLKYFCSHERLSGLNFIGRSGGVETLSDEINVNIGGYQTRYNMAVWLSRCPDGKLQATYEEVGLVTKLHRFTAAEVGLGNLRPVVEWDWKYPSGSFSPVVMQMTGEVHYW